MVDDSPYEPTVLTAIWRYRWLVSLILAGALVLAALFALSQPLRFEAVATLVVEDPRASTLFDTGAASRPERYVSNQASILLSDLLAQRASEIAGGNERQISPSEISENLEVIVVGESDEIQVTFTANSPEWAVAGANAVAMAYDEIRLDTASRSFDRAIEQLDNSIATLDQRLAEVSGEIEALFASDGSLGLLEEQYHQALARLVELQAALAGGSGDIDETRGSLDDILQQLQTLQTVIEVEQTSPQLAALLEEQGLIIEGRADLRSRRDGLAVDASLESTGIVLFSPALEAEEAGASLLPTMAAALVLGGLLAAAVAYGLAVRRREFTERSQPELVVGAPLLTEVPDFREERVSEIPVRFNPASLSAEAFRFVVPAIQRASRVGNGAEDTMSALAAKSFAIVSAAEGDGKTIVTANLAIATAIQARRVLTVDADFGDQRLTSVLAGRQFSVESPFDSYRAIGMTDLTDRAVKLKDVIRKVEIGGAPAFDHLSRGGASVTAAEFFASDLAKTIFQDIRDMYDVILIDAPPLLQVAYSSLLVQYSDRTILVIPHRSSVGRIEELVDRLEFLEAETLGYIYTKAPLRTDLPRNEGSTRDILGTGRALWIPVADQNDRPMFSE